MDAVDGFHWPCDTQIAAGPAGSEAVGHAENLADRGVRKVGCVYVATAVTAEDKNPGVWTCDYANF